VTIKSQDYECEFTIKSDFSVLQSNDIQDLKDARKIRAKKIAIQLISDELQSSEK